LRKNSFNAILRYQEETVTPKKAAVIIINWNGKKNVLSCLESLSRISCSPFGIIVVDNASWDGSPEVIKERFSDVRVIETGSNIGYGAACNLGALHALGQGYDYLYFSNNDILFHPDFLKRLVDRMGAEPDLGILGASVYHMDRPDEIQSLGLRFDRFHRIHNIEAIDGNATDGSFPVDSIMGGAFLMTREAFTQTSGFDPFYFMYFEEVDLCARTREKGFRVATALDAVVWHQVYGSFDGDETPLSVYYRFRNHLLFLRKNRSKADYITYVAAGFAYVVPRKVLLSIKQKKGRLISACLKGWINGLTLMPIKHK
jgi:hypothetical protein